MISRIFSPRRFNVARAFTFGVLLGLAIVPTPQRSTALAAPAPGAPPTLDAPGKRVMDRLLVILHRRVKKPDGTPVHIEVTPTARAAEGYFSRILIRDAPVQLKKKLRVSQVLLDARNVRIDVPLLWSERRVRTFSSQTSLRAVISESDLTSMLAKGRHTAEMGLRVRFLGDKLGVTGNLNYALINGPIVGVGKLRMAPGHKVYLDILSLKLRGVEVPAFIKNQFSGRINPVINYDDLPFSPPFKGVKVVGNKAYLTT